MNRRKKVKINLSSTQPGVYAVQANLGGVISIPEMTLELNDLLERQSKGEKELVLEANTVLSLPVMIMLLNKLFVSESNKKQLVTKLKASGLK